MKTTRLIYLTLATLLVLSCNRQKEEGQFTISITLEQTKEVSLVLSVLDTGGYKAVETIHTDKKGRFEKTYPLKHQTIYKLALSENDYAMFVAQPQEKIMIAANTESFSSSYRIENSKVSEQLKILNGENMLTRQKLALLSEMLHQSRYENNEEAIKKIKEQYLALQQYERLFTLDFIDKNIGNLASVVALYRTFDGQWLIFANELDTYNKVLAGLRQTMPDNPQTTYLQSCIDKNQKLLNHINNSQNGNATGQK